MYQTFSLFRTAAAAALALGLSIALPAAADTVIYNNGAPDQFGVYYADANNINTEVASPFSLAAGSSTVGGATWWGGCYPEVVCPTANLTVYFYTDVAGAPGALIASYPVGNANQTATGALISTPGAPPPFDEYIYSAHFGPLPLVPGVNYFFAVGNNTGEVDTWGQETANAFAPSGSHYVLTSGTWNPAPSTLAFELTAPAAVPEPSSFLLLGTALGAAALLLRRKFSAA